MKLLLEGHQVVADGEYRFWQWGERTHPPLTLFCRNLLSTRPTEFLSLANEGTNLSYFPCGGAALGTVLVSSFRKLRICPWTLTVKTDDYTYATSGGHLLQTYWNGQRRLEFFEVPYATARDAAGHAHSATSLSRNRGQAQIDLRGTGLAVDTGEFMSVGCASFGRVCVPTESCAEPKTRVQQRVALYGGGYAGRMAAEQDRTTDERAAGENFDDEGRNGGWVLPLIRETEASISPALYRAPAIAELPPTVCPVATTAMAGAASPVSVAGIESEPMHVFAV